MFQVLLPSDNHKNSELDILVLNNYKKELMEGKMHIQYICTFCFLPSLYLQRKREWPVQGRNTTWKILRTICKPRRRAYRRPWCKVSSTWNDFFSFPRSRSYGRTHKTWRDRHAEGKRTVSWRNEGSVEEIGEKKFHIDIWVLHGKLDTGCVCIYFEITETARYRSLTLLVFWLKLVDKRIWSLGSLGSLYSKQIVSFITNLLLWYIVSLNIVWL